MNHSSANSRKGSTQSHVYQAVLRIALFTKDGRVPRWMWNALQSAIGRGDVELVLAAAITDVPQAQFPWMVEAYARWERGRYLTADNPLEQVQLDAIDGKALRLQAGDLSAVDTHLEGSGADVVLMTPEVDLLELGDIRLPVWKLQFGDKARDHRYPGLWEVADRTPSSVSLLETEPEGASRRVLETIVTRTDPRSWVRNQLNLAGKASDLLERWLRPVPSRAWRSAEGVSTNHASDETIDARASTAVLRMLGRFGRHVVASALHLPQWQVAVDCSIEFPCLHQPEILTPPPDRSWCDPFLVARDGTLYLFIEEYLYSAAKGRIAVLTRSPSGAWSGPVTVLELSHHLSYPFVFEHGGELLMVPESSDVGRVELYRCLQFPDRWELDQVMIDNVAGADATLWYQQGRWWMFLDVRGELCLYHSSALRGPWVPHCLNPVKSDARSTRPAGRIFRRGQDVIRPAQDCSVQYGREVVFNKITRLSMSEFEEVEICRLQTPWSGSIGCHTFNQLGDITVVDRLVPRLRHGTLLRTE